MPTEKSSSNTSKVSDDSYIAKLKTAGKSDQEVATRLGLPVELVAERWHMMSTASQAYEDNGYNQLIAAVNGCFGAYRNLGETLLPVGQAFGDLPTVDAIAKCYVDGSPTETALNIMKNFVVLAPYRRTTPPPLSEEASKKN